MHSQNTNFFWGLLMLFVWFLVCVTTVLHAVLSSSSSSSLPPPQLARPAKHGNAVTTIHSPLTPTSENRATKIKSMIWSSYSPFPSPPFPRSTFSVNQTVEKGRCTAVLLECYTKTCKPVEQTTKLYMYATMTHNDFFCWVHKHKVRTVASIIFVWTTLLNFVFNTSTPQPYW